MPASPSFPRAAHLYAAILISGSMVPAAGAQATAQGVAPPVGSEVELELAGGRAIRGSLGGRAGDDLLLVRDATDTSRIHIADVIHANRLEGRGRRGWNAVGAGAAVGAGLGAILIGLASADRSSPERGVGVAIAIMGAGALTVSGTVIGGAIGLLPEDHWAEFDPRIIAEVPSVGAH